MKRRTRDLWKRDKGAAIALVGSMLVILMGMAAFGSDLAWFYLNASRVQRAADGASLGGVVWMPGDQATAFSTAYDIALRNKYDNDLPNVTVTPETVPGELNQLKVTVQDIVPTFFLKVLGFDTMTISRSATAEYIPPLRLGSPSNEFGNRCDPLQPGCSGQANFWANIHGKWTSTIMGDAYSSWCANSSDNPSCKQNPIARSGGYLYGIESDGASSFTIEFVDVAFHNTSGGNNTGDYIRTGDRGCEAWGPSDDEDCGPSMYVALYAPDPTPLDVSDNVRLCEAFITPQPQGLPGDPYVPTSPNPCFVNQPMGPGIYILQVRHVDPGATKDRAGLNRYSVFSSAGTKLFALGDFSIYNNADISTTSFYLAEVPDLYAGKTFVVELYDPGESKKNGTLQVVDPSGGVFSSGECRIYDRNKTTQPWVLQTTINPGGSGGNPCQELVTPKEYNGRWLKFEMDLPVGYSCSNCWWKMNYVYTSSVNDTTTWRAYIFGNPIHLVPTS